MTLRVKVWIGALVALLITWLLQPFWVRNVEAVMESRGWDQAFNRLISHLSSGGGEMTSYWNDLLNSGFWWGALTVLIVWGFFEIVYAYKQGSRREIGGSSLLRADGLYVGTTNVDTNNVGETLEITITMRCFNGTGETIFVQSVNGHVRAEETTDGRTVLLADLPPAWLSEGHETGSLPTNKEFTISLHQRVPKAIAKNLENLGSEGMTLNLERLNVIIASQSRPNETARLPVWDGIKVLRNPEILHSGRSVVLHIKSTKLGLN